jgi:hypothetical protein
VDAWVDAGLRDLTVEDLLRLYLHGFHAADAVVYREYGFDDVDAWLTFHRNGVSEDLIAAVVESGGPEIDVARIVGLYRQGVGSGDVRAAARLIEADFDWDALVYLWRRGVATSYAEALVESDWAGLDEEAIVQLASNGLETAWILSVRAAGGADLDIDELVRLRNYGVRARDYEVYAQAGFASIDDIRVLVAAGVDARFLARLDEAGFDDLDVDEIVEARHAGLDRWLARRSPSGS